MSMTTATPFSAKHWIKANLSGRQRLSPQTLVVISDFTLMWNIFENLVCDNHAGVHQFDRVAGEIARDRTLPPLIEEAVAFWAGRYLVGSEFNASFYDLGFRNGDRCEHVKAALRGEKDVQGQCLAVMIIVYRLRNNLFHGRKEISTLNGQVSNLIMACRSLGAILQVHMSGQHHLEL
jgi:hypothetical protein